MANRFLALLRDLLFCRKRSDSGEELINRGVAKSGIFSGETFSSRDSKSMTDAAFTLRDSVWNDLDWLAETGSTRDLIRFAAAAIREALPFWEENVPERIVYDDSSLGLRHVVPRQAIRQWLDRLDASPEKWGKREEDSSADLVWELSDAAEAGDIRLLPEADSVLLAADALAELASDFDQEDRYDFALDALDQLFTEDVEREEFFRRVFQRFRQSPDVSPPPFF